MDKIKKSSKYIDSRHITDEEIDTTRTSLFMLTMTLNDCVVGLTDIQVDNLFDLYKKTFKELFDDYEIIKFFQADLNPYDPEKNEPEHDHELFVNIYKNNKWTVIPDDFVLLEFIKDIEIEWSIEVGSEKNRIHTHATISVKHDYNILMDVPMLMKYISGKFYYLTGIKKTPYVNCKKTTSKVNNYWRYLRGLKRKTINAQLIKEKLEKEKINSI